MKGRAVAGLLVVAVGLGLGALWATRTPTPRPNLIVVVWDTVRADRTSVYGHSRDTTPFLTRFAQQSRVYEHAIASSEWTGPTHASLFTGLPLRSHGMDTYTPWLDDQHLTLAEHLQAHGYETWAFTGNRFVSGFSNMLQGFEHQHHTFKGPLKKASAAATRRKLIAQDASTEISPAWTPHGHGEGWSKKLTLFKDAAPVAHRAFGRYLDAREPEVPFFAFINLMEAHQPRIPSKASRRALMDSETFRLALETDASLFALMAFVSGKHDFTPAELDAMAATYDAAVLDLDRALESLVADLEARGLLEETVIVVTSDHGELLGEHGMYSHRWALYEPLVHVPLVVHVPGREAGRVPGPVSMNGLFASLCEVLGVPTPETVSPALDGHEGPVFSELRDPNRVMRVVTDAFPDVSPDQFLRRLSAVIDGELKLIRGGEDGPALYDLASDPGETDDLASRRPPETARLMEALESWESNTPAYSGSSADSSRPSMADDPEVRRMLEVLGYTADEGDP